MMSVESNKVCNSAVIKASSDSLCRAHLCVCHRWERVHVNCCWSWCCQLPHRRYSCVCVCVCVCPLHAAREHSGQVHMLGLLHKMYPVHSLWSPLGDSFCGIFFIVLMHCQPYDSNWRRKKTVLFIVCCCKRFLCIMQVWSKIGCR